jgi:NitT/TauT family transport system substrate-binding protein
MATASRTLALLSIASLLLVGCRPSAPAASNSAGSPPSAAGVTASSPAGADGSAVANPPASAGSSAAASAPAGAGGGAVASGAAASAPAPLAPPVTLKVGHAGTFGGAPLFIAKQRGYFTAEGLDVQPEGFSVSADIIPAIATGELGAASAAINPALFNAAARGIALTLVADAGSAQPGRTNTSLVIRKDVVDSGRYARLADLRGLTIGVPGPYTVVHYMLALIAERNGFPLDDVRITPVPMADSLLALRNGSLDGYYDVEPSPTIAERESIGVRVLGTDELYPGFQSSVVFYGPSLTAQPDAARRFMVAYVRGVRDYLTAFFEGKETDRAVDDVRREGIAVPREIIAGGVDPDARLSVASIEAILDWWQQVGALPSKPDLHAMTDNQYVDEAVARLGPAK